MNEAIISLSRQFLELKNRSYERYFFKNNPIKHRFMILKGQRGVGKTTTLIQYLLDFSQGDVSDNRILYVQSDHIVLAGSSLYSIAEQFKLMGGKWLALDEIHKYSGWSGELKSIYDTFPELIILASGSSALEIHKGTHDLSRRAIIYNMVGLSFREYLELITSESFPCYSLSDILSNHEKISHQITDTLKQGNKLILPEFLNYLAYGYYPYFLEINDKHLYWMTLEQNVHVTIESDLSSIYPALSGNSLNKLKQLLLFISRSVPFTPNWKKISEIVDITDTRTLKSYFKHLEDAGLIKSLSKYSKMIKNLEQPEKIYLDNSNQIYAFTQGQGDKGNIRETFFMNMLSVNHDIALPAQGDFIVDGKYTFEVGGRKKSFMQIRDLENAFVVRDGIEHGIGQKLPLWLFGFIY